MKNVSIGNIENIDVENFTSLETVESLFKDSIKTKEAGILNFLFWKPKPNSHLYGLRFVNNETHKRVLLETIDRRFMLLLTKFKKMVNNPEFINPTTRDHIQNNLNLMVSSLLNMEESLEYLTKYSDLNPNGKIFGLRLRIENFMEIINYYKFLLRFYSPHKDALKYFKFDVTIESGYIYGIQKNFRIVIILDKYRELYKLKLENGEFKDVY